jgi:hypothetical protein
MKTILVPDWHSDKIKLVAEDDKPVGISLLQNQSGLVPCNLKYQDDTDEYAIVLKRRRFKLPFAYARVPFREFILIKRNSPLTWAPGGFYGGYDGTSAYVETYVRGGVYQQSITVHGPFLSEANKFFDRLVNGELNHLCPNPESLPEQPLNVQLLNARERVLAKIEEMFHGDIGRYYDFSVLASDLREMQAMLSGEPERKPTEERDPRQVLEEVRHFTRTARARGFGPKGENKPFNFIMSVGRVLHSAACFGDDAPDTLEMMRRHLEAVIEDSQDEHSATPEYVQALQELQQIIGVAPGIEQKPAEANLEEARRIARDLREVAGERLDRELLVLSGDLWKALDIPVPEL